MKSSPWHASLLALALFAVAAPVHAAGTSNADTMVVAQAADGTQAFDQVRKFLAGGKNLSKLDADRLQQRLKRAEKFKQMAGLPADLSSQLDQEISDLNAEIANRQQAGSTAGSTDTAGTSTAPATTDAGQSTADAGSGQQQTAGAASSGDIDSFLQSVQPVDGLNDKDLRQQMRKAAELSKSSGISGAQKKQLREIVRNGRAEMDRRKGGSTDAQQGTASGTAGDATGAGKTNGSGQQTADNGQSATGTAAGSGEIVSFLQSVQPVSGLNDKDLRQQMGKAAQLSKTAGISAEQKKQLREIVRSSRAELETRKGGTGNGNAGNGNAGNTNAGNGQQQTGNGTGTAAGNGTVDQASEQKARAILDANVDAGKLDKASLRKRLTDMRDLLQSNQLSPQTKQALRAKLAAERTILRGEVSGGKAGGNASGDTNIIINNTTTINKDVVKVVINDRRPGADLPDVELRRRIDVLRVIVVDKSYGDAERQQWRLVLDRDRVVLRDRLLKGKRDRTAKLKNRNDINIDLSLNFRPDRPVPPRSVFAAEADDQEITDILAAPPRRKIDRRYTVDEVETNPQLRDAVARIEIDTVHFGFGEGFLREEEIDKLDRIAEVLEKILAKSPGEVFMIEGHTDAVGSDGANLDLSRERAKAVKEALTTYYVIPEENLKPVGFGEKYLKIPTEDPEAENRRVSIARITPLVGELQ